MKQDKLHDALDLLDENMVAEVDALRRRKKTKKRWLQMVGLAACLCAVLIGVLTPMLTGTAIAATDLMEGVQANSAPTDTDLTADSAAITDFGVRLFQSSMTEGKNTLISPLSVLCALAMTANGAEGETLAQMEEVLGLDVDTLNTWLHTYTAQLPVGDNYKLSLANSIWFTEDEQFTVNQDFLQTNADYYGADIYSAPFDNSTLKDINNWVKKNTDGMIPSILDEIPEEAVMYLINALAFDAQWQTIYKETQVRDGTFTTEDGRKQDVELMFSSEGLYLEDENATGFLKYYADRKYAFAALLPNEGVSVADYVSTLTGEHLHNLLSTPEQTSVDVAIPKFMTETSLDMREILQNMGMTDAFDYWTANFSGLGSSSKESVNIVINRVLHKTFIQVDERGTKAGAATAVQMTGDGAAPPPPKEVILDRPFVYMLIDCETNLPFFIGTMMDVTG